MTKKDKLARKTDYEIAMRFMRRSKENNILLQEIGFDDWHLEGSYALCTALSNIIPQGRLVGLGSEQDAADHVMLQVGTIYLETSSIHDYKTVIFEYNRFSKINGKIFSIGPDTITGILGSSDFQLRLVALIRLHLQPFLEKWLPTLV